MEEIKQWEQMAVIEVRQAKEFGAELSSLYLHACINNMRRLIFEENPFILATSDIRYRTFVLKILSILRNEESPIFESFTTNLILGKYSNNLKYR